MSEKKVLITGADGQVGSELLIAAPPGAIVHAGSRQLLDITDIDACHRLVRQLKPDWIINCAAYTAVDRAESEADLAMRVNRDGARNLALAASECGSRLVHLSTDFVFDGCRGSPYRPEDPPSPLGVYGHSKLEGEYAVLKATDGDALVVRTAWLYSVYGKNIVKTLLRLFVESAEVRVVADQIGSPTSAACLAAALWDLVKLNPAGGTYHYTNAGVASWYDLAHAVREIASSCAGTRSLGNLLPIGTIEYPTAARRPPFSVLDNTSTAALIGKAQHWREPLKEMLPQLMRDYR